MNSDDNYVYNKRGKAVPKEITMLDLILENRELKSKIYVLKRAIADIKNTIGNPNGYGPLDYNE